MRRKIEVRAGAVSITATIDSRGKFLAREEVDRVREQLADRLQDAAAGVLYIGVPRNRVVVR